jgi:excisionase family DNA binding protein
MVGFDKAQQLTDISKPTLRRYAAEGRIKVIRVGRRVLIPIEELRRFIGLDAEEEKKAAAH